MMPRYDLLPQHKGDDEAVARLRQLPEAELLPLLPRLLDGLMDSNWPIAYPIWELLLPHVHLLVPDILEVLAGTDETWKGNLLHLLSCSALPELPATLRQVVERIAYTPTTVEHNEDTDEAARNLLARFA